MTFRRSHGAPTRRAIPTLLVLAVLASSLTACKHEEHEAEEGGGRIIASHPLRRSVTVTREFVCQVQASRHIDVRAQARGYIERVAVNEGQRVEAGTLMFAIQPLTYRAEYEKASAEVAAARVEYDNTKRLADGNVVSPPELALAEARFKKAQAEQQLAAAHLSFTEIKAPFDGLMDRLQVREGSLVDEGELLTTLSDNRHMWVYFNVPEADYLAYQTRSASERTRPVRLRMANGQVFNQTGSIGAIEADFNSETGTIAFRADFPNPAGLLRHGQTCNVMLESPVPNALLIPQKSTFEVLDHRYAYVLGTDGVVHQRRLTVREGLEDLFIVEAGLAEGDVVLIEGLRQVRDGQRIEAEVVDATKAYGSLKLPSE